MRSLRNLCCFTPVVVGWPGMCGGGVGIFVCLCFVCILQVQI